MKDKLKTEIELVLQETIRKPHTFFRYDSFGSLISSLSCFASFVFSLVQMGILITSFPSQQANIAINAVNAAFLFCFSMGMLLFSLYLHNFAWRSRVSAVKQLLHTATNRIEASFFDPSFSNNNNNETLVRSSLDENQWAYTPNNFLTTEDIVALQGGKRVPADVSCISTGSITKRDEVLSGNGVETCRILQSPLIHDVSSFLESSDISQETELGSQLWQLSLWLHFAVSVAAVLCALVSIAYFNPASEQVSWVEIFVLRPLSLLILISTWPLFQSGLEFFYFWDRDHRPMPLMPSTLLHLMGSVTTLCNLDEETLLIDTFRRVEEVFVLDENSEFITVDCFLTPSGSLGFEDPEWANHLNSLKPIGFACTMQASLQEHQLGNHHILETQQKNVHHVAGYTFDEMLLELQPHYHLTGHLFQLANAIGVLPPHNSFRVVCQIFVVKDASTTMECLLVVGNATSDSNNNQEECHLLCMGDFSLVVDFCTECWNGESVSPLSSELREEIRSMGERWEKEDILPTAFSYRPYSGIIQHGIRYVYISSLPFSTAATVSSDENTPFEENDEFTRSICTHLVRGQIFTGMAGSPLIPKPEVGTLVETLWQCGIRFVHFSPRDTRKTRKIAEHLGMDTDWNTSISLGPANHEVAQDWELRLPKGIEAIIHHLQSVDDVPLRVSMFTDVSPQTIFEMLHIMRDMGREVTVVYGLPLRNSNAYRFANVSIAMHPPLLASWSLRWASLPCSFAFSDHSSLLPLMGKGRVSLYNYLQANQAFLSLCAIALLVQLIVAFSSPGQALTLGHVLWLTWVEIPLLAFAPAIRPRSMQDMLKRRMPWKRTVVPKVPYVRYCAYFVMRIFPCVLYVLGIYYASVLTSTELFAQCMVMLSIVWCGAVLTLTFASRTTFTLERKFYVVWVGLSSFALLLQIVYNCVFALLVAGECALAFEADMVVWLVWAFAPPVFVPLFAYPAKRHDAGLNNRAMRLLRLDFETKLGQFSPK